MTLRPRDRIALGVVLLFVVIAGFYLFVLKPEQKHASSLETQISVQRQALAQAQSTYATGRAARAALKASSAEWTAVHRAIPDSSDIPALLRVLDRNAKAVHVKMTAITLADAGGAGSGVTTTPAPSTGTTTTGAGGAASAATAAVPAVATSVPLQLTFSGGYTALNKLVRRLNGLVAVNGKSLRATGPLLSISNVSLSGSPALTVSLTAAIYQLNAASTATTVPTGGQS